MSQEKRLNRRSFLSSVAGAAAGGVALAAVAGTASRAQPTDRDPNDGVGRGYTGRSDNDSGDRANHGRGGGGAAASGRSGITDQDSSDQQGNGRGTGNGRTDRDPNDRPGRGYSGRSDRDSNDRAGHGR